MAWVFRQSWADFGEVTPVPPMRATAQLGLSRVAPRSWRLTSAPQSDGVGRSALGSKPSWQCTVKAQLVQVARESCKHLQEADLALCPKGMAWRGALARMRGASSRGIEEKVEGGGGHDVRPGWPKNVAGVCLAELGFGQNSRCHRPLDLCDGSGFGDPGRSRLPIFAQVVVVRGRLRQQIPGERLFGPQRAFPTSCVAPVRLLV